MFLKLCNECFLDSMYYYRFTCTCKSEDKPQFHGHCLFTHPDEDNDVYMTKMFDGTGLCVYMCLLSHRQDITLYNYNRRPKCLLL